MTKPMVLLYAGVGFAAVGGLIAAQLLFIELRRSLKSKLKDDVGYWRGWKALPLYVRHYYPLRFVVKRYALLVVILFIVGVATAIFAIGFSEVFL